MSRFLFGNLIIGIGLVYWNWPSRFVGPYAVDRTFRLILWFCVVPFLSTWFTAVLVNHFSPRKLFLPGKHGVMLPIFRGSATGLLCMLLAIPAVVYLLPQVRWMKEIVVMTTCSTISTLIVILLSPKSRPGVCRRCDYDIRASLSQGRCPECGSTI